MEVLIISVKDIPINEEITFKDGSPAVEVGQSVKKGELLISAFDQEGKPTYAKGEVYGRVYGTFSVFIPRTDTEIVRHEYVKVKKSIKFLKTLEVAGLVCYNRKMTVIMDKNR